MGWVYALVAAGLLILGVGFVAFRESFFGIDTGGIPVPPTPFPKEVVLAMAKEFRETLRDPQSAKFSETRVGYQSGEYGVCGLVNANNAYGALSGDSFFKMKISKLESGNFWAFLVVGQPDKLSRMRDFSESFEEPCWGIDKMP